MSLNEKMISKYREFCAEYNYDDNNSNNIYSIYDFTDFIQLNLEDNERVEYIRYFIDTIANRDDVIFKGNLHEITVLNDDETNEFVGNLVHFYHGDNLCESFYALIYFDEYPNFFEKTDSIEQNIELEVQGKLRINTEMSDGFYFLELHDVKYLEEDGESIIL